MIDEKILLGLEEYLAKNYRQVVEELNMASPSMEPIVEARPKRPQRRTLLSSFKASKKAEEPTFDNFAPMPKMACSAYDFEVDESFSSCLLRMIDERGLKDSDVYNEAHIDRRLFSKIRSGNDDKPKKRTVFALVIAMKLSLKDAEELLKKAGYSFSPSQLFDVIVKYFIENGIYDFELIDEVLLSKDQETVRTY